MRERDIEQYLRDKAKTIGCKAYKFISPGNDGMPDRFIGLPGGLSVFVETKTPGRESTPLQRKRQQELANLGFPVFSDIDSKEQVDQVIIYCKGLMKK